MLILGGLIGFGLCFVLVAVPLASTMATQVGLTLVLPIVGTVLSPLFMPGILLGTLIHILLVLGFYLLVVWATPVPPSGPVVFPGPAANPGSQPAEQLGRGALIGINACANLILLPFAVPWIVSWNGVALAWAISNETWWQIAAVAICIANLMALNQAICANRAFAAVLGWYCWIAATAWPANFVGIIFFLISVAFGARLDFEWWTGSVIVHGGPLNVGDPPTAYDLSNFLFIDPKLQRRTPIFTTAPLPGGGRAPVALGTTADGLVFHETGHTLNVGAFGAWFHYIGFIHEQFLGGGAAAYSEILPEGHLRDAAKPWFPLWAPPVGIGGMSSNTPPTLPIATVNGAGAGGRIVVSALTPLTLSGGGLPTDPDNFPQGAVTPGVGPSVGVLWGFLSKPPGSTAHPLFPNANDTVAVADIGGDYQIGYAVTDGIDLAEGASLMVASTNPALAGAFVTLSNIFDLSVVQAVATVPATGAANTDIPISAAGSTAGTAGTLPTPGGAPPPAALTVAWAANPAGLTFVGSTAATTTMQTAVPGHYDISLTVTTPGGVSDTTTAGIDIS